MMSDIDIEESYYKLRFMYIRKHYIINIFIYTYIYDISDVVYKLMSF